MMKKLAISLMVTLLLQGGTEGLAEGSRPGQKVVLGGHAGNGGYAVVCRDDNEEITSIEVVDHSEARLLDQEIDLGPQELSVDKKVQLVIDRIKRFDLKRAYRWQLAYHEFKTKQKLDESKPTPTNDINSIVQPPEGCAFEIVIRQENEERLKYRYFLNPELWKHEKLSENGKPYTLPYRPDVTIYPKDQRVKIITHELAYWDLLKSSGEQMDSRNARHFNRGLTSKDFGSEEATSEDYYTILSESKIDQSSYHIWSYFAGIKLPIGDGEEIDEPQKGTLRPRKGMRYQLRYPISTKIKGAPVRLRGEVFFAPNHGSEVTLSKEGNESAVFFFENRIPITLKPGGKFGSFKKNRTFFSEQVREFEILGSANLPFIGDKEVEFKDVLALSPYKSWVRYGILANDTTVEDEDDLSWTFAKDTFLWRGESDSHFGGTLARQFDYPAGDQTVSFTEKTDLDVSMMKKRYEDQDGEEYFTRKTRLKGTLTEEVPFKTKWGSGIISSGSPASLTVHPWDIYKKGNRMEFHSGKINAVALTLSKEKSLRFESLRKTRDWSWLLELLEENRIHMENYGITVTFPKDSELYLGKITYSSLFLRGEILKSDALIDEYVRKHVGFFDRDKVRKELKKATTRLKISIPLHFKKGADGYRWEGSKRRLKPGDIYELKPIIDPEEDE